MQISGSWERARGRSPIVRDVTPRQPAPSQCEVSPAPSIGIVFAQFAAYHVDRCEAVGARLKGRFRVRAVEVATTSATYAWEASGEVRGCEKVTLFAGRSFEQVGRFARFIAEYRALRRCRFVFVGLSYGLTDAIALSWSLRLTGSRVIVLTESKFDDYRRYWWREAGKALLLGAYHAGIVGGRRQVEYLRFLGFRRRPVLPGYDTVGVDRVRRQAAAGARSAVAWQDRPFVFVGRFVPKKNLAVLLQAYAAYVGLGTGQPRRLVMIGDGPLRRELTELAGVLRIGGWIDWPGFLPADGVSRRLADGLALCLVSTEEQWGLVVNEAAALSLPIIASHQVGACDALVRNGVNGFVVEPQDITQIAQCMARLAADRELWTSMSRASHDCASLGDAERFADAVEQLCDPRASAARP